MELDRKKEIVSICLDLFVEKGLSRTSTRDIGKALQLQNAALYYYFKTKTDAVVACFDVALSRLETDLLIPTNVDLDNPKSLFANFSFVQMKWCLLQDLSSKHGHLFNIELC